MFRLQGREFRTSFFCWGQTFCKRFPQATLPATIEDDSHDHSSQIWKPVCSWIPSLFRTIQKTIERLFQELLHFFSCLLVVSKTFWLDNKSSELLEKRKNKFFRENKRHLKCKRQGQFSTSFAQKDGFFYNAEGQHKIAMGYFLEFVDRASPCYSVGLQNAKILFCLAQI